jgi:hypothetical protein
VSARSSLPSIAELRAVTQPAAIFARNSGEHWAGRLYVRRLSPYLTRWLLPTRVTPNAVTWGMLVVGMLAAGVLTLPGLLPAVAAALLIQLQILLDCSAGRPVGEDSAAVAAPRASGLRRLRRALGFFPFFRAFVAVEATLLALVAAVIDAAAGNLQATRVLVIALVPVAAVTAAGHLFAILASERLR